MLKTINCIEEVKMKIKKTTPQILGGIIAYLFIVAWIVVLIKLIIWLARL